MKRKRMLSIAALFVAISGIAFPVSIHTVSAERTTLLSEPLVRVSKSGAISASGKADCSADVLAQWPGYVGAPDVVYTNVSWKVYQRKGREVVSAVFNDAMASPCWARHTFPWISADECVTSSDGSLHPCRWDSSNYGSTGWVYGSSVFKPGTVHLAATLEGGYYSLPGDEDFSDLGPFEIREWDLLAVKG